MAKPALEVVAARPALIAAWKHVSRGKLMSASASRAGVDGESLESFARSLETNLGAISARLRTGAYRFSSLQPFFIPKSNGKKRLICVPTIADRVVQRAVLDFLTPKNGGWLANGVSHGFVPDLGVPDAVGLAVRYRAARPWVCKTDISAFFDRIDRSLLLHRVEAQIKHRSLHFLLKSAIACEIAITKASVGRDLKVLDIRVGRGVRQGMPLSPFFANLLLKPFDEACKAQGLSAVRYADDLIFFADTEEQAKHILTFCTDNLKALKLQIPELGEGSKTQIYGPHDAAEFLGVDLRLSGRGEYEVAIPSRLMQEIKNRIYSYGNLTELRARGLDVTKFGNALRSSTAAYDATYAFCANHKDLKNHLHTWERETLTRVVRALGIDVQTLTDDQQWFLGVT